MTTRKTTNPLFTSRRLFLQSSALAGTSLALGQAVARSAHAAGNETLKIGLVGCGGRGAGAAANALDADPGTKLVAVGDAFGDVIPGRLQSLIEKYPGRVDVPAERCFDGFDACQKVIASGVDVVILATPPHFRPQHLKACIEAGKHVFVEKPVAVDAPGVRSILATCDEARKKGLSVVSGLCFRFNRGVQETMKRVHDGAIG
ncbi:MAG: Gfo/Idh/MocA family protein, partial [Thermoguttaceae bacterium]